MWYTPSGTRTHNLTLRRGAPYPLGHGGPSYAQNQKGATSWDRTRDLQIFSLTLSQLSYRGTSRIAGLTVFLIFFQKMLYIVNFTQLTVEPLGAIRKNWNDTEKISMAPAQGWHAQIENVSLFFFVFCLKINDKKKYMHLQWGSNPRPQD